MVIAVGALLPFTSISTQANPPETAPPPPPAFRPPSPPPPPPSRGPGPGKESRREAEAPARPENHDRRNSRHREHAVSTDLDVLDRILAMPPEQLTRIREAIERIEGMSPEKRNEIRDRLNQFRDLSPEQRQKMREHWRAMSPEDRAEKMKELQDHHWKEFFSEPEEEDHSSAPE